MGNTQKGPIPQLVSGRFSHSAMLRMWPRGLCMHHCVHQSLIIINSIYTKCATLLCSANRKPMDAGLKFYTSIHNFFDLYVSPCIFNLFLFLPAPCCSWCSWQHDPPPTLGPHHRPDAVGHRGGGQGQGRVEANSIYIVLFWELF